MANSTGATQRLGGFVAQCAKLTISPDAIETAAIRLLDAIGLGIIAGTERTVVAMRDLVARVGDAPHTARIWADGTRAVLSEATTVNALAVHAHFHDDCEMSSWTHPGSLIIPVAVSAGEAANASLDRVLRAVLAGYATIAWLGAKERVARALIDRGIRTSPTLGTLAAAAAAAVVLDLDEFHAANAVGIASSITGGVLEPVRAGSDEWRLQNAHAARGGLLAAQLARRGILGAPGGLEGPTGLARALAGLGETPPEWSADPRVDAIHDAWAKPWATLGDNMAAVAAAKLLHDAGIDERGIRRINVRIWHHFTQYPGTSYRGPYERTAQALASTVFGVAAMLAYGELEYDTPLNHRQDPRILRLAELTTVEPDHEGTWADATVEIESADGSRTRRSARESPRTLLFHDRETATRLIERRLSRAGFREGGAAVAPMVFDAIDRRSHLPIRAVLDGLYRGVARP